MAELNQIQFYDNSIYDIKDAVARQIVLDGSTSPVNLPDNMTIQDLYDKFNLGKLIGIVKDNLFYTLVKVDTYTYNETTYFSLYFENIISNGTVKRIYTTSTVSTATTISIPTPSITYLTLPTRYCTGTLDKTSTGTTFTIPSGYENGQLIFWGRPRGAAYTSTVVPLSEFSTTGSLIQLSDQTGYISYQITKTNNTIKCVLSNQSTSSASIDCVYITP